MLQRLILPLAWRSLLLSVVVAGIAFVFIAPEELRIDRPHDGIYHVFTSTTALLSATAYRGSASVVGAVRSPAQRNSRYLKDPDGRAGPLMFQFAPEIQRPTGDDVPGARTSIAIDVFGNTYIAADGSSLALGEAQITIAKLYDYQYPQWAAALGASRVYVASAAEDRLVLRRSDDAGRTFDEPSVIARLADPGVSAGHGNLVVDSDGTVYNVYTSTSHNEIFLAICESRCERFVTRRIFSGASGMTLAHPYPVLAVDNSGGLHVVFNDGRTVFLISSADGGATWKDAATVNNPDDPETASASSPWVFAGDSGRLGIVWTGPRGNTYYAFTHDAFSAVPAFSYVDVGDPEPNAGLPSGAADPFGDASIVYGSGRFVRQVSGERLISGLSVIETGVLKTDTGAKRFSLITRQDLSGRLIFLDEERRVSLRSTQFTAFTRHNEKTSISGKGVLQDGTAVSFTVVVSDAAGRVARARNLTIAMSNGYFAAGVLEPEPLETKLHQTGNRSGLRLNNTKTGRPGNRRSLKTTPSDSTQDL